MVACTVVDGIFRGLNVSLFCMIVNIPSRLTCSSVQLCLFYVLLTTLEDSIVTVAFVLAVLILVLLTRLGVTGNFNMPTWLACYKQVLKLLGMQVINSD